MARDGDKLAQKGNIEKLRSPLKKPPQTPVIGPSNPQMMMQQSSKSSMKSLSVMSSPTIDGKMPASHHNFQLSQESKNFSKASTTLSSIACLRRPYQQKPKQVEEGKAKNGRWSLLEHLRFLEALKLYGKNWKQIEEHISTRTSTQARSHAQKFFGNIQKSQMTMEQYLDSVSIERIVEIRARVINRQNGKQAQEDCYSDEESLAEDNWEFLMIHTSKKATDDYHKSHVRESAQNLENGNQSSLNSQSKIKAKETPIKQTSTIIIPNQGFACDAENNNKRKRRLTFNRRLNEENSEESKDCEDADDQIKSTVAKRRKSSCVKMMLQKSNTATTSLSTTSDEGGKQSGILITLQPTNQQIQDVINENYDQNLSAHNSSYEYQVHTGDCATLSKVDQCCNENNFVCDNGDGPSHHNSYHSITTPQSNQNYNTGYELSGSRPREQLLQDQVQQLNGGFRNDQIEECNYTLNFSSENLQENQHLHNQSHMLTPRGDFVRDNGSLLEPLNALQHPDYHQTHLNKDALEVPHHQVYENDEGHATNFEDESHRLMLPPSVNHHNYLQNLQGAPIPHTYHTYTHFGIYRERRESLDSERQFHLGLMATSHQQISIERNQATLTAISQSLGAADTPINHQFQNDLLPPHSDYLLRSRASRCASLDLNEYIGGSAKDTINNRNDDSQDVLSFNNKAIGNNGPIASTFWQSSQQSALKRLHSSMI